MIIRNPETYENLDILCRVYENQTPNYWSNVNRDEKQQICVEVLFSNRSGINDTNKRATAWLPIGAAEFMVENIKPYITTKRIGICNELPSCVGYLLSVNSSFEDAFDRVYTEKCSVNKWKDRSTDVIIEF